MNEWSLTLSQWTVLHELGREFGYVELSGGPLRTAEGLATRGFLKRQRYLKRLPASRRSFRITERGREALDRKGRLR